MSIPTIGRIVHYILSDDDLAKLASAGAHNPNNGQRVAPAIITAVWGSTTVNLRVFVDGAENPLSVTSSQLADGIEGLAPVEPMPKGRWFWPPRV